MRTWKVATQLLAGSGPVKPSPICRYSGVTPTSIFGLSWTLAPLVAAILVGILGIARALSAKPFLAALYLIFWLLGSLVLGVTILFVIFGLRSGALGEAIGYALCFAANRLWRGARRPHAAMT